MKICLLLAIFTCLAYPTEPNTDTCENNMYKKMLNFSHTFFELGAKFYQAIEPTKVAEPNILLWNADLARDLGIEMEDP